MKVYLSILFLLVSLVFLNAQTTKVAILDFENTSGKTEYDALGKAISSMLITDLANNIHPKKVEFFERSQLNKLLDEQKLQKSKDFDANTAVDFGKLSGVNYVFLGSVFVLDGTCNFSSKLVDVQTSKILIAKDVRGKIEDWLPLKSQLAEALANQLNNPITLDPSYKDQKTSLATINQYGKILTTMDGGDVEKAEQMRALFEETNPDFKYFKDMKDEIEKLKEKVAELENITSIITNSFSLGVKSIEKNDYSNTIKYFKHYIENKDTSEYLGNRKLYAYTKLAFAYLKKENYVDALENIEKALKIYKYYPEALELEIVILKKLGKDDQANSKIKFLVHSLNLMLEIGDFPVNYNCSYIGDYISAYNYGTTTKKTGEFPNQLLWYLVYNQSATGLNSWGLKFNKEDYACFYSGIGIYGYDSRYKDNSIKLNSLLNGFGFQKISVINSQPRCVSLKGLSFGVDVVKFSPNSKYVITASKDTVKLWDVSTGKKLQSFVETGCSACWINSVNFSSDSKYIVITTQRSGLIRVWDVLTGKEIQNFIGHENEIQSACFSSDNKYIVSSSYDETSRIWDVASGNEMQILNGYEDYRQLPALFSHDGKYVATGDSVIRIWEFSSGKKLHELTSNADIVALFCFSNDSKHILTATDNGTVCVWNAFTGKKIHTLKVSEGEVYSALFSPNNKFIITTSVDDIVRMWDVLTGKEIRSFEGHSNSVFSASISPDNKLLVTGSCDHTARVWDIATGKELFTLSGHRGIVNAAFSPDGNHIITASDSDKNARLWDVLSGKEIKAF